MKIVKSVCYAVFFAVLVLILFFKIYHYMAFKANMKSFWERFCESYQAEGSEAAYLLTSGYYRSIKELPQFESDFGEICAQSREYDVFHGFGDSGIILPYTEESVGWFIKVSFVNEEYFVDDAPQLLAP